MSGFDQSSIAVSMPTVVGADAALGGPYKIKPSEAFSGALMTVSGLTGETISVETSPDGYWGAPASPSFYRTDWQGRQRMYPTARTNYCPRSQDIEVWTQTSGAITTANQTTAPDGTTTADKLATSGTLAGYANAGTTIANATKFVASAYFKNIDSPVSQIYIRTAANSGAVAIAWSGSSITSVTPTQGATSAGFEAVGGGWYRVWTAGTTAEANPIFRLYPGNLNTTESVYVWGAQIEADNGSGKPTAYIPTTTAAVTVTDYNISNGVITLAETPVTGAALSYDNSVLPSPYYIFATGDGVRTTFAYDGVWGTLSANSGKGNGIWQVDLRGAQAYRLVKSAGSETATVNMTLKRDALQYTNSAGTWSVT